MCQVLYRDDGAPLGCVLRPHGGEATYAYTTTGALRRLGFVPDRRRGQARGRAHAHRRAERRARAGN
jgi:hypothetical protein